MAHPRAIKANNPEILIPHKKYWYGISKIYLSIFNVKLKAIGNVLKTTKIGNINHY
jgi:hypothetical protein